MEKNIVLSDENFKQVYKKIVNMAFALINSNSSLKLFIEEKPSIKADIEKIILEVLADYKKNRIPIKIAEENKKFIKVANPVLGPAAQAAGATLPAAGAATGTGAAAGGAGGFARMMGNFGSNSNSAEAVEKLLKGEWQGLIDLLPGNNILKVIFKKAISVVDRAIKQQFNPEFIRRLYILNTMQDIAKKKEPFQYSASAFQKVLDQKGYKGQEHSRGAYDTRSGTIDKEIEDYKKIHPKDFEKGFSEYDDPALKERLKKKSFNETQVRTSQAEFKKLNKSEKTDEVYETLVKLTPQWTEENLKQALLKVAERNDLTDEQKQQGMIQALEPYRKSIQPLHNYLQKIKSTKK